VITENVPKGMLDLNLDVTAGYDARKKVIYAGVSKNPQRRLIEHLKKYKNNNSQM
jgi:hypothetical protein